MEIADRSAPERLRALPSWLLNQTALLATRLVSDELAAVGLRRYHYSLMTALDEGGPASQAELGRRTTIDRSDMVAAVNELSDLGLVARAPDRADGRRNIVRLTPAGRRRLRQLEARVAGAQDELLAPLSASERRQLVALLTRMLDHRAAGS
jgi:DNA-binding MarR family transcriptional regulator